MKTGRNPLFCALDLFELEPALALARAVSTWIGGLKLGKAFFTAQGPQGVAAIGALGLPIFLDLKFHDIPNTVGDAIRAAAVLRPALITVHATGGPAMMRAAVAAARETAPDAIPAIVGVTVLTSLDQSDLDAVGLRGPVHDRVRRLAALAAECGLDGVVCSPHEIAALRAECGPDFALVVPGIRPAGSAADDQKRVMGPAEAMAEGATHLVVGRAITGTSDPAAAARSIAEAVGASPRATS
jgi:orotidine-5'-phosphate decarboxylase